MKYTLNTLFTLASIGLFGGCITPFTPDIGSGHESLMVVEGMIIEGETVIRLGKSMDIYPDSDDQETTTTGMVWYENPVVTGARVWIEGDNGDLFDAVETVGTGLIDGYVGTGEYRATEIYFTDEVRYRLRISYGGEEYQSDWRLPQTAPVIEQIEFNYKGESHPLEVRFDVTGEQGGSRYYLWNYEETWETAARMTSYNYFARRENETGFPTLLPYGAYRVSLEDDDPSNDLKVFEFKGNYPYFYCWKYNTSKQILIEDTERLTDNRLIDYVLYEINLTDDRLSQLYHTKVTLYTIGEDAYYYFSNQRRNTDEIGDIFAPIPSEMTGNITCTTSPDTQVIGFVDVARRTDKEIYLHRDNSHYIPFYRPCYTMDDAQSLDLGLTDFDFYPVLVPKAGPGQYTTRDCIDCRVNGGSKLRPQWWPNDHF